MATAVISDTFQIVYDQAAGTGTATIANPGRAFRIVSILGTGLNTSVITCRKNTGAGVTIGTCTLATGDLDDFPSVMSTTAADMVLSATDNIHITVATANATRVVFLCVAESGYDLTVS
jgi:hypothetical protein